jgi:hypothetical protein
MIARAVEAQGHAVQSGAVRPAARHLEVRKQQVVALDLCAEAALFSVLLDASRVSCGQGKVGVNRPGGRAQFGAALIMMLFPDSTVMESQGRQ